MAKSLTQKYCVKPIVLLVLYSTAIWLNIATAQPVFSQEQGADSIRFAVIGDYGDSESPFLGAVADMIAGWEPDFIVTVGDNNYPDGAAETIDANIGQFFHDYIYPYQGAYGDGAEENRFFPAIGNHDYTVDDSLDPYLDYFTLPGNERYYDFVWGPVQFFILASDRHEPDGNEMGSIQATWLEQALTASSTAWQVVILHHAPYSSGLHGSDEDLQWPFQEWGADVVLSGHDHDYERVNIDGLPYIVTGAGGTNMRTVDNHIPGSEVQYNAAHGALLVNADEQQMNFEYYTIRGRPIDAITTGHVEAWIELDVTAAMTEAETQTLAVTTGSNSSVYLCSTEGGCPPELVIETSNSSSPYVLTPTDDTYIRGGRGDSNYGDDPALRIRNDELFDFYAFLRFDTSSVSGEIQRATLRLYITQGNIKGGFAVYTVPPTQLDGLTLWTEDNLVANSAPVIQGSADPIDAFTIRHDQ